MFRLIVEVVMGNSPSPFSPFVCQVTSSAVAYACARMSSLYFVPFSLGILYLDWLRQGGGN